MKLAPHWQTSEQKGAKLIRCCQRSWQHGGADFVASSSQINLVWVQRFEFTFQGVKMTAELIAQLATLFLILGAGPIIVVFLYARGKNLKRISPTSLASCQPDQRPAHHMGPQVPRKLVLLVVQQPIKWARLLELHPFHGQQAAAKSGSLGAASAGGVNKVGFSSGLPL
jgi:hypothetical protein